MKPLPHSKKKRVEELGVWESNFTIWSYLPNLNQIKHKVTINPRIFHLKLVYSWWIDLYICNFSPQKLTYHLCPYTTAMHVQVHSSVSQFFESCFHCLWNYLLYFFCCIIAFLLYIVGLRRRKGRKESILSILLIFRLFFLLISFKVRCFISQAVCTPCSTKCEVKLLP